MAQVDAIPHCPVCGEYASDLVRDYSVDVAAQHFVPCSRDPKRHSKLRSALVDLWGTGTVEVRRCTGCGIAFAVPFVAGDVGFYNIVSESNPHYPSWRWEFDKTLASLRALYSEASGPLHLLELGAGDGAFLKRLRSSPIGAFFEVTAMDYDLGALKRLHKAGFATYSGSAIELAKERPNAFSVVCLFQTLEHISDVHGLFEAISRLLMRQGHIFVSVPNGPAVDLQEELTGFWDMPPNHVVRWTRAGLEQLAYIHGLRLAEWALQYPYRVQAALQLSRYRVLARAYNERSFAARVNALPRRWIRGPLKLALATALAPPILRSWRRLLPPTQWAHFRAVA